MQLDRRRVLFDCTLALDLSSFHAQPVNPPTTNHVVLRLSGCMASFDATLDSHTAFDKKSAAMPFELTRAWYASSRVLERLQKLTAITYPS